MLTREGEVREIPFLGNDMKDHAATTGKPLDQADAPGKADSELTEENGPEKPSEPEKPIGNVTINADDALLDDSADNKA
jgi:hypothetical protein